MNPALLKSQFVWHHWFMRAIQSALAVVVAACFVWACGAEPPPKPAPTVVRPPPSDPLFPTGYDSWATAPAVTDDINEDVRKFYRSPDAKRPAGGVPPVGAVYVKAHHGLQNPNVVTGIDVRRRTGEGEFGGWEYLSFDPATRQRRKIDPETCHLCHAAAPEAGTFTQF